ncbi:SLAM family member 9-like [Centroberyx affinis]|uniref:SLAM family member 9-like n=1 Tax=Centroberyx affinis TaxID=166261 RepID=UPI003A5C4EA3
MSASTLTGLLCVCLLAAVSADSQEPLYKKVGDSVVLSPDLSSVTGPITSIEWKHGSDLAMEWDGAEVDSYRQFKDRGDLNISTGALRITGLTREDSGLYTAELNNKATSQTQLSVISPVPKPTVSTSCDTELTVCLLTCDGDTRGAEPVTYSWSQGDMVLPTLPKQRNITKEDDSLERLISCSLTNPVSYEHSEDISNPLYHRMPVALKGIIVFFSLLALLLVPIFIHRWKAGVWFYETASMPWEADFWRRQEGPARVDDADNESPSATGNEKAIYKANGEKDSVEAAESNATSAATEERQPEAEGLMTADGQATPDQEQ